MLIPSPFPARAILSPPWLGHRQPQHLLCDQLHQALGEGEDRGPGQPLGPGESGLQRDGQLQGGQVPVGWGAQTPQYTPIGPEFNWELGTRAGPLMLVFATLVSLCPHVQTPYRPSQPSDHPTGEGVCILPMLPHAFMLPVCCPLWLHTQPNPLPNGPRGNPNGTLRVPWANTGHGDVHGQHHLPRPTAALPALSASASPC